jgi:hypothetical protein
VNAQALLSKTTCGLQVEGLTGSLQAKHEESCYLQLQLMTAAQNMQLMGGQLHGQVDMAQVRHWLNKMQWLNKMH